MDFFTERESSIIICTCAAKTVVTNHFKPKIPDLSLYKRQDLPTEKFIEKDSSDSSSNWSFILYWGTDNGWFRFTVYIYIYTLIGWYWCWLLFFFFFFKVNVFICYLLCNKQTSFKQNGMVYEPLSMLTVCVYNSKFKFTQSNFSSFCHIISSMNVSTCQRTEAFKCAIYRSTYLWI